MSRLRHCRSSASSARRRRKRCWKDSTAGSPSAATANHRPVRRRRAWAWASTTSRNASDPTLVRRPEMKFKTLRALVHGALAAVLVACGGGEGGIGGTGGADVSVGSITAFGSVWVNGVEYQTNASTTIRIDDNVRPESELRVGMVARVDGSIANASASAITVKSAVKGYVEAVAADQMV